MGLYNVCASGAGVIHSTVHAIETTWLTKRHFESKLPTLLPRTSVNSFADFNGCPVNARNDGAAQCGGLTIHRPSVESDVSSRSYPPSFLWLCQNRPSAV